ncbi:MAG: DUF2793 domain-containing protein [Gammaproteobacteria bacterium]
MTTPILALDEIVSSQAGKEITHNTALRQLEGRLIRAKDNDLTTPPGSPAEGDAYIIPSGATGVWASQTSKVAHFSGGVWTFYTPIEGVRLWLNDEDTEYAFDASSWVAYAIVGRLSKSVAGGSDVTLTAVEARNQILEFTGTLTANINVIVPTAPWEWIVYNATAGAFTLMVKAASGIGVTVTQGKRAIVYVDGTNVVQGLTDPAELPTGAVQSIAYAANITPDGALGERVIVGALTGNLAINAPTNPRTGALLVFTFAQDATGGRTISWNATFKKAADGAPPIRRGPQPSSTTGPAGSRWVGPWPSRNTVEDLESRFVRHEGVRRFAYDDATGKPVRPETTVRGKITAGAGGNLADTGLSADEIGYLLRNDIERCRGEIDTGAA